MNAVHQPPTGIIPPGREKPGSETAQRPYDPRIVSSGALFNGANEIVIEHAGSYYRLKITRQNKLILNK